MSSASIKSEYAKWLWLLALFDFLAIALLMQGFLSKMTPSELLGWRWLAAVVIPIVVVLTVNVLPHDVKAMLVYWKPMGWLPSSESFGKLGPSDPRIDMQALTASIGELPVDPKEQTLVWYRLFKMIENDPRVVNLHKDFLMYRDMAIFSLCLTLLAPSYLYLVGVSSSSPWIAVCIFVAQYLLTAISSRHSGNRLVTNVLAVHAAQRVTKAKQATRA